ncbi:hypothetical protein DSECCO2_25910 [anaerobic digester metagenome]
MEEDKVRDQVLELNKLLATQLSDSQKVLSAELFKSIIDYGKQTLNGLFLLNGAAAVAVIYNKTQIEKCWIPLLTWCVAGVVMAVACSALSYFAQRCYFISHLNNSRIQTDVFVKKTMELYLTGAIKTEVPKWKESKLGQILTCITVLIAMLSFCCFLYAFFRLLSEFSA